MIALILVLAVEFQRRRKCVGGIANSNCQHNLNAKQLNRY